MCNISNAILFYCLNSTNCLNLHPLLPQLCTTLCRTVLLYGVEPQGQLCLDTLPVRKTSRCPLHTITFANTLQWLSGNLSKSDVLLAGEPKGCSSEQTDQTSFKAAAAVTVTVTTSINTTSAAWRGCLHSVSTRQTLWTFSGKRLVGLDHWSVWYRPSVVCPLTVWGSHFVVAAPSFKGKHCSDPLWWSAVTAFSIESSLQCWVRGWIQCEPLQLQGPFCWRKKTAKVILWQRLVSQTLAQWWSTQRGWGRWCCVHWVTRHWHCSCTDNCVYCVSHLHSIFTSKTVVELCISQH